MHLSSTSFEPYGWLDSRLAFGKHDPESHFTFAGNRNPHLAWTGAPEGTRSFAVICCDPDVPSVGDDVNQEGKTVPVDLPRVPFFHWVLIDIPTSITAIEEGTHSASVSPGGKSQAEASLNGRAGRTNYTDWFAGSGEPMEGEYFGYDGPAPPWNDERVHGYAFTVYALDVPSLALEGSFTGPDALQAMEGHVLAQATMIGLYAINPDVAPG